MGCGSSQSTAAVAPEATDEQQQQQPDQNGTVKPTYPRAESFEVLLDESDGSIIKKHPPKRLLDRLAVEAPNSTPATIEHLEQKLANAEIRRNKFLQERVERIKEADENTASIGADSTSGQSVVGAANSDEVAKECPQEASSHKDDI